MPGKKRPTDQDAATARRALLDGLTRDADIFEVLSELAPLHPRNDTFPGEVSFTWPRTRWNGAGPAQPLPLEGLRERFLSECAFRGRQNAKLQYAVLAAAGPDRTCSRKSPTGRLTTSGSTPCTRRSPASAPPPAGRASQSGMHARTSASAPASGLPADYDRVLNALPSWRRHTDCSLQCFGCVDILWDDGADVGWPSLGGS